VNDEDHSSQLIPMTLARIAITYIPELTLRHPRQTGLGAVTA
jgi:hypothetical protein